MMHRGAYNRLRSLAPSMVLFIYLEKGCGLVCMVVLFVFFCIISSVR